MLVAVIGLGTFGEKTATRLFEKGAEVVAIDNNPELADKIKDRVTHAICLDVTEEKAVRRQIFQESDFGKVPFGKIFETT